MAERADLARAQSLLDLHRAVEAEEMLRDYVRAEPDSAYALTLLGRALDAQDRHTEALQVLEGAVAADPQSSYAFLVMSEVLVELKLKERAIQAAQEVIRIAPWDWTGHYALARSLTMAPRPRLRDAIDRLDHARALAPHEPQIPAFAGLILIDLKETAAATGRFQEALAIDPQEEMALRGMAILHTQAGRLGRAGRVVTSGFQANPQSTLARDGLDHILTRLLARWFWALAAGGLLVATLLATHQSYFWRPLVAVAVIGLYARHARTVLAALPDGVRWWGPDALWRISRARAGIAVFLAAASVTYVAVSLLPAHAAVVVGLGFLMGTRLFLAWIVLGSFVLGFVAAVRWLAGRVGSGRQK